MTTLHHLLDNNKNWAERIQREDPDFFKKLVGQQTPEYLWIGCSDSRVPANQIVGLLPGEVFVHRNVANLVVHTDLNCLSVIQYAVEVLKVKHVIVCGHYGCGGVRAALQSQRFGLIDNWLRHIEDIVHRYQNKLGDANANATWDKLCELNVVQQALHVTQTTIIQEAWKRGQDLTVHGWIYSIQDGLLRDLHIQASNAEDAIAQHEKALQTVLGG